MKKIYISALLIASSCMAIGQWNPMDVMSTTETLNDMTFIDATKGFIAGGDWSTPSSELFMTIDGGATWTSTSISSAALWSIQFLDANEGYISTTQNLSGMDLCYKTVDGGTTWTPFNTGLWNDGIIYFPNNSTAYHYSPNNGDDVAYSTDGGSTWTHAIGSPISFNGSSVVDMHFPSANTGYAVTGWGGEIFKATNDTVWTSLGNPTSSPYLAVHFYDDLTGYAMSGDTIVKTADGGTTWTVANSTVGGAGFGDIYCAGPNECYVLADQEVYYSTDGCSTLTAMTGLSGNGGLKKLYFANGNGYAIGYTGSAYNLDPSAGITELANEKKNLLKIVDFMGRETEFKPNTPLIIIYSDGTRERVVNMEY